MACLGLYVRLSPILCENNPFTKKSLRPKKPGTETEDGFLISLPKNVLKVKNEMKGFSHQITMKQ